MGALGDGRTVVLAAGTRVQLSTVSVAVTSVTVSAETDNTGVVVVGGPTVIAALLTRRGIALAAGDTVSFSAAIDEVDDLSEIWLDAMVNGDGVTYIYGDAS